MTIEWVGVMASLEDRRDPRSVVAVFNPIVLMAIIIQVASRPDIVSNDNCSIQQSKVWKRPNKGADSLPVVRSTSLDERPIILKVVGWYSGFVQGKPVSKNHSIP